MITLYYSFYAPCAVKEKHKEEHRVGRALLSHGLEELYNIHIPAEQLDGKLVKNEYGKPALQNHPEIFFNISHCDELVICGFSDSEIGVDVEDIARFQESIFRRVLTPEEKEFLEQYREQEDMFREYFYRFWTLKESRLKEAGHGLAMPMTDFSFQIDASCDPAVITCSQKDVFFYQQKMTDTRILSVCSRQPIPEIRLTELQV